MPTLPSKSFLRGDVLVSYGLLTELTVNGKYGPWRIAACPDDDIGVSVRVSRPQLDESQQSAALANGNLVQEEAIAAHAVINRKAACIGVAA